MIIESLKPLETDITSIKIDPRNARKHPVNNLAAIKKSLETYGQRKPIVVNQNTNTIEAGNGLYMAAKELGWPTIACVYVDDTKEMSTAYGLMDNQSALISEWDLPTLKDLLQELDTGEIDMAITGFTSEEIEDLMTQFHVPEEGLTEDDAVPEQVETVCKKGDLWKLGEHRLLCGDATVITDVERLMDGQKAVLMVTDPPYGVNLDQSWRDEALGDKAMGPGNKHKVDNDNRVDWFDVWSIAPVQIAYIWHASKYTDVVMNSLRKADFEIIQQIIWNKSIMVMGRSDYHFKHEPCWYCVKKGSNHKWIGDRTQTTVWDAPAPNHIMSGSKEAKTEHPTQKPVVLWEMPITNHLPAHGLLYEPFSGSGTAFIACEKLGRRCYGIEISSAYCDVIRTRWEQFTGKQAELINA